jgi:hypothetical protein
MNRLLAFIGSELSRAWLLSMCCAYCIGCGSRGPTQVAVNGTVAFDGQAIKQGKIVFEPIGSGKMSVGEIIDGSYEIAAKRGPIAGNYLVRITAMRPTGKKLKAAVYAEDQTPVDVFEQFVPQRFNQLSELKVIIESTNNEVHDFALNSSQAK